MTDLDDAPKKARIQFNYIKGPGYREVPCHGVIGGVTPEGLVWLSMFTERPPIPRIVEYEVSARSGETIEFSEQGATPTSIESRTGIVRHIETTTYISLDVAKRIHAWLGGHIETLDKQKVVAHEPPIQN